MIEHLVIAFNNDPKDECHSFFQACADSARQIASDHKKEHHWVEYNNLNADYIFCQVNSIDKPLVFVAVSHGYENALVNSSNEDYLSDTVNDYLFHSNIVYAISCLSSNVLGGKLVSKGVRAYWGYKEEFIIYIGDDIFMDCAMEGLRQLVNGEELEVAFRKAREKYEQEVEIMFRQDYLRASNLFANGMALTLHSI